MVEEQVVQAFHSLWRRFDARHLIQLGSRLVAEQQCRERCDRHFITWSGSRSVGTQCPFQRRM